MMIVATIGSMTILILSLTALQGIYGWYPRFVAQQWFMYDQLLTISSFLELMFGALATALIFQKKLLGSSGISNGLHSLWCKCFRGFVDSASGTVVAIITLLFPAPVRSTVDRNSPNLSAKTKPWNNQNRALSKLSNPRIAQT